MILNYQFFVPSQNLANYRNSQIDSGFGWKIPVAKNNASGQVTDTSAYSQFRKKGGIPGGLPVRLQIPIIGVDTAIEDAYVTPDGRMDVPSGSVNVAWYALGPHPGEKGSAVIGGHFGIDKGIPKVFYNLNKLNVGDKVYILDDKNQVLEFVVKSIRLFGRDADASTVFYSTDSLAHLNIITCEGVWNKVNDSYPDRRVVFTDWQGLVKTPLITPVITPVSISSKSSSKSIITPVVLPSASTNPFNRASSFFYNLIFNNSQ